jgi:hypothetical protein
MVIVLFTKTAAAQNNLLVNPAFDAGTFTNRGDGFQILPAGSTVMTGWTVVGDSLAWGTTPNLAPNVTEILPKDGNRFLDLQGDGLVSPFKHRPTSSPGSRLALPQPPAGSPASPTRPPRARRGVSTGPSGPLDSWPRRLQ